MSSGLARNLLSSRCISRYNTKVSRQVMTSTAIGRIASFSAFPADSVAPESLPSRKPDISTPDVLTKPDIQSGRASMTLDTALSVMLPTEFVTALLTAGLSIASYILNDTNLPRNDALIYEAMDISMPASDLDAPRTALNMMNPIKISISITS